MIEFSTSKTRVDLDQLKELFAQVGWGDKTKDEARLRYMAENSTLVVTAWDGDRMVGFGRATTDRAFNGQINNVVVTSDYRKQGIGRQIMGKCSPHPVGLVTVPRRPTAARSYIRSPGTCSMTVFAPSEHHELEAIGTVSLQ